MELEGRCNGKEELRQLGGFGMTSRNG